MEAHCAEHPDRPAIGACLRCGRFVCEQDSRTLDDELYCSTCAARPDVDWLEAFRRRYWGKRDTWAWLVGAGGLFSLLWVPTLFTEGRQLDSAGPGFAAFLAVQRLVVVAVCFGFWGGLRWARVAFLGLPAGVAAIDVLVSRRLASAFPAVLPMIFAIAIFLDTRNQLFFRVPVSRARLLRAWNLYANNVVARTGFQLSLAGLLIPLFAPLAVAFSLVGLHRVDPGARPPIGRKGQAIAGIVLGSIGTLWGLWLAFRLWRNAP